MKKQKDNFLLLKFFLIIGGIIFFDQLTKYFVLKQVINQIPLMSDFETISTDAMLIKYLAPFLSIVLVFNKGISFSMMTFDNSYMPYILIGITFIIVSFLVHYLFYEEKDKYNKIFLICIIGGALGNIIDRIRFKAVIDFIDFHIKSHHYPAFNVADSFISVFAVLWIVRSLLKAHKKKSYGK